MRYRRSSYRYAAVVGPQQTWVLGEIWSSDRLRLSAQNRWCPDVDVYETATTVEVIVDLAGVHEDDVEVQLFEDAVIVEGHRHVPARDEVARYHRASIRQGAFRVDVALPVAIDAERVDARYEGGLLRITLARRAGGR